MLSKTDLKSLNFNLKKRFLIMIVRGFIASYPSLVRFFKAKFDDICKKDDYDFTKTELIEMIRWFDKKTAFRIKEEK